MILPLKSFSVLLEDMSAGLQGGSAQLTDLSVGSVLRSLLEACAAVALWMQWLILQVLTTTRAATSTGADLDTWMADFSFSRLPGATSTGLVSLSRYTSGSTALIPVGAIVRTSDGTVSFSIIPDATNVAWNGAGYVLPATISNIVLPIQALMPGSMGNVVAGAITLLGSAIAGVDSVINADQLAGGIDAESDMSFRTRFLLYVNSRSLATDTAVGSAIQAIQQGLRYTVVENIDRSGQPSPGNFCVYVDNGGGAMSSSLLSAISGAVDYVRPVGSTFSVSLPELATVNVSMSLSLSEGANNGLVIQEVQQAVVSWIAGLPIGGTLAVSKLEALAHAADAAVASVSLTTINGEAIDVWAGSSGVLTVGSITVGIE